MKSSLRLSLLSALVCALAPVAAAQLVLHNFTAFESPNTFFVGDWELNGDPAGSNAPRGTFSQGAGSYNFVGGSNSDSAAAVFFFTTPLDISGHSLLEVSAQIIAGGGEEEAVNANMAPTFTVSLFDSLGESAFAVFSTSSFESPGFVTVSAALTFSPSFNAADLASFLISGNVVGGTEVLNLAMDNLAVRSAQVAVPEPATYGLFGAAALACWVVSRRWHPRRDAALRR